MGNGMPLKPLKPHPIPRNCTTCERRSRCHNGRGMIIAWHCGRWEPARRYIEERKKYMAARKWEGAKTE